MKAGAWRRPFRFPICLPRARAQRLFDTLSPSNAPPTAWHTGKKVAPVRVCSANFPGGNLCLTSGSRAPEKTERNQGLE
jgi:hypothetical protein